MLVICSVYCIDRSKVRESFPLLLLLSKDPKDMPGPIYGRSRGGIAGTAGNTGVLNFVRFTSNATRLAPAIIIFQLPRPLNTIVYNMW